MGRKLTEDQRYERRQRSAWRALYIHHARKFLRQLPAGATFTGEDVRNYISARAGAPHNPNCWGGMAAYVFGVWQKHDQIEHAGLSRMKLKKAHARSTPLYRKSGGFRALWRRIIKG